MMIWSVLPVTRGVALFTRAWIEMTCGIIAYGRNASPSSRGRGLKYHNASSPLYIRPVALFTRAWIEIRIIIYKEEISMMSPSSRGRGLKLLVCTLMVLFTVSPSSRGRGLKYNSTINIKRCNIVALFTRAWIEIISQIFASLQQLVALFTRAWIEIASTNTGNRSASSRPLHDGVD